MIPKKFYKMKIDEQERYLVEKLQEIYKQEDQIKKMLAQVRSGYEFEAKEDDRPDLIILKDGN